MSKQCEIVQDLLPLYVDGACSESSAEMIKEHLETCADCRAIYEQMCSHTSEDILQTEKDGVIARHEKIEKKKSRRKIIGVSLLSVLLCFVISMSVLSYVIFGTANFVATSYGLCKVMFTDTELVAISENPTVVIGKPNSTIDEYMLENGGYVVKSEKQLGAMYVYSNGDTEVHIMYSVNGYYAKWVWQD